jgi:hypothetical protein
MKRVLAACLFIVSLSACSSEQPIAIKTNIAPTTKINLDVLTVTVVDRSLPPNGDSPYLRNNFKPTIAEAMHDWASQHIVAVGSTGEATITIRDASLKSQALPITHDMFKRQQASKYTGHAEIELDINGREGFGRASAEASRFETLPEEPSVIEKNNAYNSVLNGLVHDTEHNFDEAVNTHLSNFVVTAPILK